MNWQNGVKNLIAVLKHMKPMKCLKNLGDHIT